MPTVKRIRSKSPRGIPRILKINAIDGYRVSLLFNHGESRVVDMAAFLREVAQVKPHQPGHRLLADEALFQRMAVVGTTVGWPELGIEGEDEEGQTTFYPYDLDPLKLYQHSQPDPARKPVIGLLIREARKAAGLTQAELAHRSGTSKHYISRLENQRSDIELMTLQKIVEAGLGKKLVLRIEG